MIGVGIALAPFFIYLGKVAEPGLYQALFFQCFSIVLICLGAEKNKRVITAAIVCAVFCIINPEPFGLFSIYQVPMVFLGLGYISAIKLDYKRAIFAALAFICIFECFWVLSEWAGFYPYERFMGLFGHELIDRYSVRPLIGSLNNKNHSGALIAATVYFAPAIFWPIAGACLLLLGSTMPIVSALAGCLAYYAYASKKWLVLKLSAIGLAVSAIGLFVFETSSGLLSSTGRIAAWSNFLETVGFSWLGNGFGFVATKWGANYQAKHGRFYQLHNEWLEVYAIAGIVGVVFMLWFIAPLFKDKKTPAVNAALIALLVNSLGNFTFHIAPLFMVFGACFALQLKER